ncbi:MAG: hypothetical protein JNM75_12705 [Rhodospirillales bacterium]|nr:hypothetical protein [Rhodospirillales bacterium]
MGRYTGTSGDDTITPTTVSAGVVADPPGSKPSVGADQIYGLGGADHLDGGAGGDTISGGAGNDSISGVNAGNVLHGNAGNDTVVVAISGESGGGGTDATNSLYGDDGDDRVTVTYGHLGYDGYLPHGTLSLYGGDGADVLGADAPYAWSGDIYFHTVPTYMYGGAGNDTIQGTKYDFNSDGTFDGGYADFLYGGPGDDTYLLFGQATIVEKAGAGFDTIIMRDGDFTLPANVEKLVLEDGGYYQSGRQGIGNDQDNVIIGTSYADGLDGRGGNDRIFGDYGDDLIYGGSGNDSLAGQAGNDTLWGGVGNDHLGGGTGNDTLYGEAGVDALTGRQGADTLSGGGGNDRFVYEDLADSKPGAANHDTILDMAGIGAAVGDRIDLAHIDADATKGGNQAFVFVSSTAALKAGQLHVVAGGGTDSLVQGEVDGQAGVDFEILVHDGATKPGDWTVGDFIL